MKRAVLAVVAAAMGAAVVVGLAPRSAGPHAIALGPGASPRPTPSASGSRERHHDGNRPGDGPRPTATPTARATSNPKPTSTPQSSAKSSPASTATRTINGPEVSNGWGPFQVTVTLKGTQITAISVPVIPGDGRSQFINSRAVPILVQEALQAQSAKINIVSGATDSSYAFAESLDAALQQAG